MKNTIIAVALTLVAIIGACWTIVNVREQKTQALELATQKAEAEARKASAKQKEAESLKLAEKSRALKAQKEAEAKKAEAETKKAAALEAEADEKTAKAEAEKAAEDAKKAKAEAEKAAAEQKSAEAKKMAALALAEAAIATNNAKQADLRLAENARLMVEANIRQTEAANEAARLKKLQLDKLLAENAELNRTLKEREAETRPERTIKDIIAENERRRAEEEAAEEEKRIAEMNEKERAEYEAARQARLKVNREGVAGPKAKPLTAAEKVLESAQKGIDDAVAAGEKDVEKRIVAKLEAAIREAVKAGQTEEADFYLKSLESLVPGYRPSADLLKSGK